MEPDQKDLPLATWSPIASTDAARAQVISDDHKREQEIADWEPTFRSIGVTDLRACLRALMDQYSVGLGREVRTIEDAYKHVRIVYGGVVTPVPEQVITEPTQPAHSADEVETLRVAWKKAIEDRKESLRLWDEHVRSLHHAYVSARDAPRVRRQKVRAQEADLQRETTESSNTQGTDALGINFQDDSTQDDDTRYHWDE